MFGYGYAYQYAQAQAYNPYQEAYAQQAYAQQAYRQQAMNGMAEAAGYAQREAYRRRFMPGYADDDDDQPRTRNRGDEAPPRRGQHFHGWVDDESVQSSPRMSGALPRRDDQARGGGSGRWGYAADYRREQAEEQARREAERQQQAREQQRQAYRDAVTREQRAREQMSYEAQGRYQSQRGYGYDDDRRSRRSSRYYDDGDRYGGGYGGVGYGYPYSRWG